MEKVKQQYRQGDVLVNKVDEIPAGAKKVEWKGRVVLAEGEATGHAHTVTVDGVTEYKTDDNRRFLQIEKTKRLNHQEHDTLVLKPGTYEITQQVEVWMDEVRQVMD